MQAYEQKYIIISIYIFLTKFKYYYNYYMLI
jgi:hypothetical protein